jgi:hypothetical protein
MRLANSQCMWRVTLIMTLSFCGVGAVSAQQADCPTARPVADSVRGRLPDIVIKGRVTAREVRFASQPQVDVQVRGCPALDTTRVSVRTNLPRPVQAGVTYRDVHVDFELSAWLREIDCAIGRSLQSRRRQNQPLATADTVLRQLLQSCPASDSLRR